MAKIGDTILADAEIRDPDGSNPRMTTLKAADITDLAMLQRLAGKLDRDFDEKDPADAAVLERLRDLRRKLAQVEPDVEPPAIVVAALANVRRREWHDRTWDPARTPPGALVGEQPAMRRFFVHGEGLDKEGQPAQFVVAVKSAAEARAVLNGSADLDAVGLSKIAKITRCKMHRDPDNAGKPGLVLVRRYVEEPVVEEGEVPATGGRVA